MYNVIIFILLTSFCHFRDTRDKVYIDNIERTASLFDQFKDTVSTGKIQHTHLHKEKET